MSKKDEKAKGQDKRSVGQSEVDGVVSCPDCGETMRHGGTSSTLVGFISPKGHNHDDNCKSRVYMCANGHKHKFSKQNTCPVCDWKGQATCFCHDGAKVENWPDEAGN